MFLHLYFTSCCYNVYNLLIDQYFSTAVFIFAFLAVYCVVDHGLLFVSLFVYGLFDFCLAVYFVVDHELLFLSLFVYGLFDICFVSTILAFFYHV